MRTIVVLGSTGSIGKNTLSVISEHQKDFEVFALTAHSNVDLLFAQSIKFLPKFVVVSQSSTAVKLEYLIMKKKLNTKVLFGEDSLIMVTTHKKVDVIVAASSGISALRPTFEALKKEKTILLANKEILVSAGEIFFDLLRVKSRPLLLPIDSEHSALYQSLPCQNKNYDPEQISKFIITASGGPFLNKDLKELVNITPDEACKHPNWDMGKKISVDSSTMMNKALEIIETYWLFGIPPEKIEVIIHPESVIHSFVVYKDGSHIAQLSAKDMRIPITYAMYYPRRKKTSSSYNSLNLAKQSLTFQKFDKNKYYCVALAYKFLKEKDYGSLIVLNASNELLVDLFLQRKIKYLDIIKYIKKVLNDLNFNYSKDINEIIDLDSKAKKYLKDIIF